MSSKNKNVLLSFLVFAFIALQFQNCSQSNFKSKNDPKLTEELDLESSISDNNLIDESESTFAGRSTQNSSNTNTTPAPEAYLGFTYNYTFIKDEKPIYISLNSSPVEIRTEARDNIEFDFNPMIAAGARYCYLVIKIDDKIQSNKKCSNFEPNADSKYSINLNQIRPNEKWTFVFHNKSKRKKMVFRIVWRTIDNRLESEKSFAELPDYQVIDPYCFISPLPSACLFWKNPVAAQGHSFQGPLRQDQVIKPIQMYPYVFEDSVLENFRSTGYLKDDSFSVYFNRLEGISTAENIQPMNIIADGKNPIDASLKKYTYGQSENSSFLQTTAFAWLSKFKKLFLNNTGKFPISNRNVKVSVLDKESNNGPYFSASNNKITLALISQPCYSENATPKIDQDCMDTIAPLTGIAGEVIVHEAGHAHHYYSIYEENEKSNQDPKTIKEKTAEIYYPYDPKFYNQNFKLRYYIGTKTVEGLPACVEDYMELNPNVITNELKNAKFLGYISRDLKMGKKDIENFKYPGAYYIPHPEDSAEFLNTISTFQKSYKTDLDYDLCKAPIFTDMYNYFCQGEAPKFDFETKGCYVLTSVYLDENYCNEKGCLSAIREGIGDVHSWLMFPNSPGIGELICNSMNPDCLTELKVRNADKTSNWNLKKFYKFDPEYEGEAHILGGYYSAALRKIYNSFINSSNPVNKKYGRRDFITLFQESLKLTSGELNFCDMKLRLISLQDKIKVEEGGRKRNLKNIVNNAFSNLKCDN